jgi:hypothetical protein
MSALFDVVAVDLESRTVRLMAEGKTAVNAYAVETMAVMRRGVDAEFFASVPTGKYKEGDLWEDR